MYLNVHSPIMGVKKIIIIIIIIIIVIIIIIILLNHYNSKYFFNENLLSLYKVSLICGIILRSAF